jgi:hypothetical protein
VEVFWWVGLPQLLEHDSVALAADCMLPGEFEAGAPDWGGGRGCSGGGGGSTLLELELAAGCRLHIGAHYGARQIFGARLYLLGQEWPYQQ